MVTIPCPFQYKPCEFDGHTWDAEKHTYHARGYTCYAIFVTRVTNQWFIIYPSSQETQTDSVHKNTLTVFEGPLPR